MAIYALIPWSVRHDKFHSRTWELPCSLYLHCLSVVLAAQCLALGVEHVPDLYTMWYLTSIAQCNDLIIKRSSSLRVRTEYDRIAIMGIGLLGRDS